MKKTILLPSLLSAACLLSANLSANDRVNGYARASGGVVTTGSGECLRTAYSDTRDRLEACGYEQPKAARVEVLATAQAATITATVEEKIVIGASMLFAVDSSVLSAQAKALIDERIHRLRGNTRLTSVMRVEGHTDSTGSEAYNHRLSKARAQAVADYIVAVAPGIGAADIDVFGLGESTPIADNATPEGRSRNRRVTIVAEGEATGAGR